MASWYRPISDVHVGNKIRTSDGATHEVSTVSNHGDYVIVRFTCGCSALQEQPSTHVELVGE